jgi:hypothetical protein
VIVVRIHGFLRMIVPLMIITAMVHRKVPGDVCGIAARGLLWRWTQARSAEAQLGFTRGVQMRLRQMDTRGPFAFGRTIDRGGE